MSFNSFTFYIQSLLISNQNIQTLGAKYRVQIEILLLHQKANVYNLVVHNFLATQFSHLQKLISKLVCIILCGDKLVIDSL